MTKLIEVPGQRHGWRAATVLPLEYFEYVEFPSSDNEGVGSSLTTTAWKAVTGILTVSTGASGNLTFDGFMWFEPLTPINGNYNVYTLWRYRRVGDYWKDGPENIAITPAQASGGAVTQIGEVESTGSITLLPNTNYEFQLFARRSSNTPAETVFIDTHGVASSVSRVSSGPTGSLVATETGPDVFSATGAVKVQGTLTATESGTDVLASAGTVLVQGTLAATEAGPDVFSASGTVSSGAVAGTLAATETGPDIFASAGAVLVQGTLVASESGSDVLSAFGTVRISGSLVAAESGSDVFASAGVVGYFGTMAATESGSDILAATGTVRIQGTLAVTESGQDTLASIGSVLVTGSLAVTESGNDIFSASGVLTAAPIAGQMSASEQNYDYFVGGTYLKPFAQYRDFDGIRRPFGVVKSRYRTIRAPRRAMRSRIKEFIYFVPRVYTGADSGQRIGYGRAIALPSSQEEQILRLQPEEQWLEDTLLTIEASVEAANPSWEDHEIMYEVLQQYRAVYASNHA